MKKLLKFFIGLIIVLVLIVVILVVAGHFVLVGLFGDNGSVLKLGVKGYSDVFDVYTSVTASPYKVKDGDLNSPENAARLNAELEEHTVHSYVFDDLGSGTMINFGSIDVASLTDEQKDYVSFYAGLSQYSEPVVLDGGMNAVSLDFVLQNDLISSRLDMEFRVKGVEISSTSSDSGNVKVIFEVEREEILSKAELDQSTSSFVRSFLNEKITITLDVALNAQNGQLTKKDVKVSLNSSTPAKSVLLVRLANLYEEGMFEQFADILTEFINLPTENKAVKEGDNRVSDVRFEGSTVVYTQRAE